MFIVVVKCDDKEDEKRITPNYIIEAFHEDSYLFEVEVKEIL